MKNTTTTALITLLAAVGLGGPTISELASRVDRLESRVAALEAVRASGSGAQTSGAATPQTGSSSASAPSVDPRLGMQVMIIEEIRLFPHDGAEEQMSSIRETAANLKRELARLRATRDRVNKNRIDLQIRKVEQRLVELSAEYERLSVPRVFFCGWDGHRDILLDVSRVAERRRENMRLGQVVRWNGDVVAKPLGFPAASDYRIIEADRVQETGKPAPERPAGRAPVWSDGLPE